MGTDNPVGSKAGDGPFGMPPSKNNVSTKKNHSFF
jgi:hypothetical protein